jgi:glutamate synthase domain-containing protein 2
MRQLFGLSVVIIHVFIYLLYRFQSEYFLYLLILTVPITILGIYDIVQTKHIILRNYPVLGHFRYMLESIRPEIQQYFIERYDDGRPFSREQRSVVYQRAKEQRDSVPFGTQHNLYESGREWLEHSMSPADASGIREKVTLGGPLCKKPYEASIFNISAMSYGSLSKNAILALNYGAKKGGFFHNTGEGGVSPHHKFHGGDLCWQIGTGYFGCRNLDGSFNAEMFEETSQLEQIKMIELKLSQGAKPGHGGMLPGSKVDAEVAKIRNVEIGKDVNSPPSHKEFNTPKGLLEFIQKLRDLSGGKPVGFKLCIGKKVEFMAICKAMLETGIMPDFITIDGAEGGTGAAPMEFTNYLGTPLNDALNFVNNTLIGCGLRKDIKLIASGKVIDPFNMITKFALGADICNSARGMMFALGCIQALRCNSNDCPTGVATNDPRLSKLLHVPSKGERVYKYHKNTIEELRHLVCATGIDNLNKIDKKFIKRRIGPGEILSYHVLYPTSTPNDLLEGKAHEFMQRVWNRSNSEVFNS